MIENLILQNICFVIGVLCVLTVLAIPVVKSTRWYRVRKFGKLRGDLKRMDNYEILRSEHLFGFSWLDDGRKSYAVIKAYNSRHALQRYFSRYKRRNKECHEYEDKTLFETSAKWGVYRVQNVRTGFKRYYK